jgi:hypothetical protein
MPLNGVTETDPQMLGPDHWGQIGTVIYRNVGGNRVMSMIGVSRDNAGAIMGLATVYVLKSINGKLAEVASTISDASGNFRFDLLEQGPYWIVAYKAGSPDVAGATVNTLQPV